MKRCPSCQQSYPDDAPDYCSNDGNRLVNEEAATYDPEQTVMASGLRGGEPAAVWLSGPSDRDEPPGPSSPNHPLVQAQQGDEQRSREQAKSEPPPQPWQPQIEQYPQAGGSAQPAQNWGGAPYPQSPAQTPYP